MRQANNMASEITSTHTHTHLNISCVSASAPGAISPQKKRRPAVDSARLQPREGRAVANSKLSYERSKRTQRRHQPTSDGMRTGVGALED